MKLHLYHDFAAARPAWDALEAEARFYAFQSYEWLALWYEHLGQRQGFVPWLVLVEHAGRPLMLLPLGRRWRFAGRLEWLGYDVTDYHGPVLHPASADLAPAEFAALWADVLDHLTGVDCVNLVRQPPQVHGLPNPFAALPGAWPSDTSFAATLGPDWPAWYEQRIKKALRADSQRQRRRLAELGTLRFAVAGDAAACDAVMDLVVQQKSRRYAETNARNYFVGAGYEAFYRAAARLRRAHLATLWLDDRPLAAHFGLVDDRRFYYLLPSFAGGEWQKFSTGRLLLEHLLAGAIARGLTVFDFTIGGEAYKRDWCDVEMPLYSVVTPRTVTGRLFAAAKRRLLKG